MLMVVCNTSKYPRNWGFKLKCLLELQHTLSPTQIQNGKSGLVTRLCVCECVRVHVCMRHVHVCYDTALLFRFT